MKKQPNRRRLESKQKINVYSYYGASRSDNNKQKRTSKDTPKKSFNHRIRNLKGRVSIIRLVLVIMAAIGLGVLFFVSHEPIIRINDNVPVSRPVAEYRQKASEIIKDSIFNRSKLTFNYKGLETKLKAEYPEIEKVVVSFDLFGDKPVVKLTLRSPTFRVISDGSRVVVDSRGTVMGAESTFTRDSVDSLPLIRDEIGLASQTGQSLLSPGEVMFISRILTSLSLSGVEVGEIYIPPTPQEIDIQLVGETWRYKLNTTELPEEQAGAVVAARQTLISNSETPREYVDIRASEKVYWR